MAMAMAMAAMMSAMGMGKRVIMAVKVTIRA
jgi:hypothetical protein